MSDLSNQRDSLRERLVLYERAVELTNSGWTRSSIAKELGVGEHTIGRWVRGRKPRRIWRHQPDLSPSSDLAYVAGFYLGDGAAAGDEPKVRFRLADRKQLEYVGGLVAKILGRAPKPYTMDRTFFFVDYDSVRLSEYLNQPFDVLLRCLKDFAREFLQGFFDAEGCATCHVDVRARRVTGLQIGVANTNLEYLRGFQALLNKVGLVSRLRATNKRGQPMTIRGKTWIRRNDVYHLVMTSMSEARNFRTLVGFRNPTKSSKLDDLVALGDIKTGDRFDWFTSRYQKQARKWARIEKKD